MNLDLLLFNVQDLFIFMDKYQGEDINEITNPKWQLLTTSFTPNKELSKIIEIQKIIKKQSPDIIMLVEVGGLESLNNFNQYFLNNEYKPYFKESNSNRGIDVGYLVKNRSQINIKFKAYTKQKLRDSRIFARGLFELKVLDKKNKLKCILYLTHLKSKLDMEKKDFEGRSQRQAEVEFILQMIKENKLSFPDTPVIIGGDLNGIIYKADTEPELEAFSQINYFDALELLNRPLKERTSYYYFDKQYNRIEQQLDYFLLDKKFQEIIGAETQILGFDPHFSPFPPENLKEKLKMPSDHMPYLLKLELF